MQVKWLIGMQHVGADALPNLFQETWKFVRRRGERQADTAAAPSLLAANGLHQAHQGRRLCGGGGSQRFDHILEDISTLKLTQPAFQEALQADCTQQLRLSHRLAFQRALNEIMPHIGT